jgi:hypothetical protein
MEQDVYIYNISHVLTKKEECDFRSIVDCLRKFL